MIDWIVDNCLSSWWSRGGGRAGMTFRCMRKIVSNFRFSDLNWQQLTWGMIWFVVDDWWANSNWITIVQDCITVSQGIVIYYFKSKWTDKNSLSPFNSCIKNYLEVRFFFNVANSADPNRPGMHMKLIKFLLKLKAPRIVYVSCNPATCARDLDYLCHGVVGIVVILNLLFL